MIEYSYPVSPMQHGLLVSSLYEQQSGIYIEQIICSLQENLNATALRESWERVLERHSVLRTSFESQGTEQLMQYVHTQVQLPLEQQDWRSLSKSLQQEQLQAYLQSDRQQGFDLNVAPLMRLALFQLAEADYKLVWTFHHALLDGRSFLIVLKEVFALYEALCQNQDCQLSQPRPYQDYINWLQQYSPANAEQFWRQLLRGFTTPTQLPRLGSHLSQASDSQSQANSHNVMEIRLSVKTTSALQSLAKEHQLTLNTLVQGAWALLLGRYSGQTDVVFGAIRACRHSAVEGIESMVGLFANAVPVRVQVEPDLPLLPWLKQLRAQWLALRDYEHTSSLQIHQWSELPQGTRLFDSLVMFENGELNADLRSLGGNWDSREFQLVEHSAYPLVLLAHAGEQLLLKINYDVRQFDEAAIHRMLLQMETLLEGIAANPSQRLWDLPLLSQAERHQILVEWNDTAEHPKYACLHQLFEAQVERTPDAVAVVFKDQQLTYQQLNSRANNIAHYLQTLGVGAEVLVGIFVERSLEMVAGLLGILKAGGAYVPLDPSYPKERLADILLDSQVAVLLTQQKLVSLLPEHQARVVCLDTDWAAIWAESEHNCITDVTPENLAYAIYTSGSTGKPKGVAIEHRGAVNTIIDINQRFRVGCEDRLLAVCPLNFDLSVYDVFGLLAAGGTLVIPEPSIAPNAADWLELMVKQQVTLWNSAPPVMQLLMGYVAHQVDVSLPCLRLVLLSGDWIALTLPEQIKALGENIEIISLGGATEASIWSIYYPIEAVNPAWKSIPYGQPLANQQFYVLDSHLQPVPIGVAGELHIGGLGLARCYLNRPDLTQTKFIPNPFCDEPQARLYKTGDLGRYLPDGNIEFLGRLDYQVKIRGFRIELGEIEATLTQHPHVREVLVIARDDRPGDKYLVAYVVPDKGQAPTINQLRAFLKQTLPEYMVPSAFVMLDSLPLTANGKIDRKALPLPESTTQEASKTFVAPTDELELQLTKIWEKVLGIRPIGVRDNFFDLGGHSLLAAQLSDQIEKALNKTMPLATIFQAPTVEQLAKILRQEGWSAPWSSVAAIQPGDTKSPLFLCQAVGLYYPLIPYLGPDQPIYALLAQVVEGQPAPPERVEDLAALYIKEMRSLQPEGPYFLGGLSFGGIIAYEMARQLAAQGQNVALLALFDSVLPGASRPLPIHTRAFVHTRNFLQLGPAYFLKQLKKKLQQLQETTMRIYGKFYVNRGLPVPHTLEYFAMREVNDEAVRNYVPQVYPGRVTLFKASNRADATTSYFDPELGWGKLAAGGLEIHDVPGDHLEILVEPNVRVLGEKLKACLDEALSVSDSELTHH